MRTRLDLFLQVAEGVAHAHANLIVHRDIKPTNILVDGDGHVKLLDFGIAKLVEDDPAAGRPMVTLAAERALTPEYAAPEQVQGGAVTTATDVYALGVLLYRLLTGSHPTAKTTATPAEHVRALIENDPVHLSEAVSALSPEVGTQVAAERRTSRDRLERMCRRDLDNILAKALKKQPPERYTTVVAFADDVGRYRRDEPVMARPDTWTYRAGKFLRRHKAGAAAAALVAATLVVATIVTAAQMVEARRQRDEAQFQARRAQASSEFMRSLVTQIGTTPMTMRQVLDKGRTALEQQYGSDPLFVGRMLMLLSGPYIELGDYETSAAMMRRALEIATETNDADLLAATHCETAYDFVQSRDLDNARTHMVEGRRHLARLDRPSPGLLVTCAVTDTQLAVAEGRTEDAVSHAAQAVALLEQTGNTLTTRYTSALSNLASAYARANKQREALATNRRLIEISERVGRGRTIGVVVALHAETTAAWTLGCWSAAERAVLKALDIARGLDASGPPLSYLALSYGRVLVVQGRLGEAETWLAQARGNSKAAPRFVWGARLELADISLTRGDVSYATAELPFIEEQVGKEIPLTAASRVRLQRLRLVRATGDLAEARRRLQDALGQEGYPGQISPTVHSLLEFGARLALEARENEEAERLARAAVTSAEQLSSPTEPSAYEGRARLTLGLVLSAMGRAGQARREIERAATLVERAAGPHPWVLEARQAMSTLAAAR